jgi:hypothetical protein
MRFIGYNAAKEMVTEANQKRRDAQAHSFCPNLAYGESRFVDSV